MRPLSFWQESEYLQNSGQAFLVRQGSLAFIEHFTTANDRSPYVTDPHSHVSKLSPILGQSPLHTYRHSHLAVHNVGSGYGTARLPTSEKLRRTSAKNLRSPRRTV